MKKIRKCCVIVLLVVLFPANIFAQERRDKEQTYVLENPYEVNKITPLQGKKIKNVVLMIGDGMSLMHVYSAWTANCGKLFLDNCQAVGTVLSFKTIPIILVILRKTIIFAHSDA